MASKPCPPDIALLPEQAGQAPGAVHVTAVLVKGATNYFGGYFGGKDRLLADTLAHVGRGAVDRVASALDATGRESPREMIETICEQFLPLDEERRRTMLVFITFRTAALTDPRLASSEKLELADSLLAAFQQQLQAATPNRTDEDLRSEAILLAAELAGLANMMLAGDVTPAVARDTSATQSTAPRGSSRRPATHGPLPSRATVAGLFGQLLRRPVVRVTSGKLRASLSWPTALVHDRFVSMTVGRESDLLNRLAANQCGAFHTWAQRLGRPHGRWADLVVGDLGLANAESNVAGLLRRMDDTDKDLTDDVLDRTLGVFARGSGGEVQLWSAWPTPDLSGRGWHSHRVPGMFREPMPADPPTPTGLQILRATEPDSLAAAERLVIEVFGSGGIPGSTLTPDVIGDDFVVWLGLIDGWPVTTAVTYVSDGLCGVYAVATTADVRRRGYGEALTWAATLYRPDLPATLQASPMGRPIYERMGYRQIAHFTVWQTSRPVEQAAAV